VWAGIRLVSNTAYLRLHSWRCGSVIRPRHQTLVHCSWKHDRHPPENRTSAAIYLVALLMSGRGCQAAATPAVAHVASSRLLRRGDVRHAALFPVFIPSEGDVVTFPYRRPRGGNVRKDATNEPGILHLLFCNDLDLRRMSCPTGNQLLRGTLEDLCFQ